VPNTRSGSPDEAAPTLLYIMKQVELAVRSRLDDMFRPIGLTALQYTALTVLERHPNLTSAQLARNSFVTSQSMADMVTALHKQGFIVRDRDPSDRRRLVLSLTAVGCRRWRRKCWLRSAPGRRLSCGGACWRAAPHCRITRRRKPSVN
jgi:DNA-binding MarR family transcriptional regulator